MDLAPKVTRFKAFSQRGNGKAHNENAVLFDGKVHQGRVREHGEVDTSQPRTASRRLLELLHIRLAKAPATASLSALFHQVQQDYVTLNASTEFHGMASTLVVFMWLGMPSPFSMSATHGLPADEWRER